MIWRHPVNEALPVDLESLLRQLLELTQALEKYLSEDGDDERLEPALDLREALLEQLADLPPESRQLSQMSESSKVLLSELKTSGERLLSQLEDRQALLQANQGELRVAHSAMQAYMPNDVVESRFIEEES